MGRSEPLLIVPLNAGSPTVPDTRIRGLGLPAIRWPVIGRNPSRGSNSRHFQRHCVCCRMAAAQPNRDRMSYPAWQVGTECPIQHFQRHLRRRDSQIGIECPNLHGK
jgi:hypothetical protein